jgi:putative sugar O-methyltransferase
MTITTLGTVGDDPELLELMVADWRRGSTVAEVTGDLVKLYESFVEDLRARTIRENIRGAVRGLTAVNGCDHHPTRSTLAKIGFNKELEASQRDALNGALRYVAEHRDAAVLPYDLSLADLDEAAFRMCDLYGQACGALPLRDIEMSTAHTPDYTFIVDGKRYSYAFLYSYLHYAHCAQFVDFARIDNVVEIGGGVGRQLEVTKKLHPHLKFYMVDLGPTLYACHQYVSAVFPGSIVPYRATRDRATITLERPGDIAFVGNWQLDQLRPAGATLSFNTAVFCIMEPQVVTRYLSALKTFSDFIYLMEPKTDLCATIYNMPAAPTFRTYEEALAGDFTLVDRRPAVRPLNYRRDFGGFEMMMWIANRSLDGSAVRPAARAARREPAR